MYVTERISSRIHEEIRKASLPKKFLEFEEIRAFGCVEARDAERARAITIRDPDDPENRIDHYCPAYIRDGTRRNLIGFSP